MLRALVAYAEREQLGDLDFESRSVDYEAHITTNGAFCGLVACGDGERRAQLNGLPISPERTNPGFPAFVVDNASYVLGVASADAKKQNARKCFDSYARLIAQAASETRDDGLRALDLFLSQPDEVARADEALRRMEAGKAQRPAAAAKLVDARSKNVLVPVLEHDGATWIHERPAVVAWWRSRRAAARQAAAAGPRGRCLVTGRLEPIIATHPFIKGAPFPGTGAKLVAYDKEAFSSHGLEQAHNAPVGELAARRYTAALNALLAREPATGRRKSAVDLGRECVCVFWTRDESDAAAYALDVLAPPPSGEAAIGAADSVWTGRRNTGFDPSPFYAVTLSANTSRVVVRDWLETTAQAVKTNLDQWFEDLALGSRSLPVPLGMLLRALEARPSAKDPAGLPAALATTLFRAAVLGGSLPRSLLAAALGRMRIPPDEKDRFDETLRLRVAVIRAVLRRQRSMPKEVTVALDESNSDPAYLYGRLFAALERLQLDASGKGAEPNATIRDRYYGAASTSPATVFGRLLSLSMHHASKARRDEASLRGERAKETIMSRLPAGPFHKSLSLEQQGLFAVGYYHQRSAFFAPKDAAPNVPTIAA